MAKKQASRGGSNQRTPRATWKGDLSFGLVAFPVEAFNVVNKQASDIHFHQLHAKCHSRIHYEKVCPVHGKVTQDEIVSGYEYERGKYVEIDAEQLDAFRTKEERTLTIDAFIAPDVIDPVYYDGRMYYLLPANKTGREAYAVMVEAMTREQAYGVGQVIFSGKQQLAIVRPVDNLLNMALLNYSTEIKPPRSFSDELPESKPNERQLKLAQSLIQGWTKTDFDFSDYHDTYRDQVAKLIASKIKGNKVVRPRKAESDGAEKPINLMDALKRSLERAKKSAKPGSARSRSSHTA